MTGPKLEKALVYTLFCCRGLWPTLEPQESVEPCLQAFLCVGPKDEVLEALDILKKNNELVIVEP